MSPKTVYLTLFHFCSNNCSLGAASLEKARFLLNEMERIRNFLIISEGQTEAVREEEIEVLRDLQDATAHLNGRPKKSQIAAAAVHQKRTSDQVEQVVTYDLYSGSHGLENCEFYHVILVARPKQGTRSDAELRRNVGSAMDMGASRKPVPALQDSHDYESAATTRTRTRKMPSSSKQRYRPRPVVERRSMIEIKYLRMKLPGNLKFEFKKIFQSFCQGGSGLDKPETIGKR